MIPSPCSAAHCARRIHERPSRSAQDRAPQFPRHFKVCFLYACDLIGPFKKIEVLFRDGVCDQWRFLVVFSVTDCAWSSLAREFFYSLILELCRFTRLYSGISTLSLTATTTLRRSLHRIFPAAYRLFDSSNFNPVVCPGSTHGRFLPATNSHHVYWEIGFIANKR